MNILRALYLRLKTLPIIGPCVVFLRNIVSSSFIARMQLRKRDLSAAKRVITELFPGNNEVLSALEEFSKSPVFKQQYAFGYSGDYDIMVLYALVRAYRPEIMVETGIASGRSSAAILQAMHDNDRGMLYSIDLPTFFDGNTPEFSKETSKGHLEYEGFVPKGGEPGWLVPDRLRARWKVILGDSKIELPKLLATLPSFEMFYHDSEHSYEVMMDEFQNVWDHIAPGGLLLSDDITWNTAWNEFTSEKKTDYISGYRHFGIARKSK